MEIVTDEAEYVNYIVEPDNKLIGQALMKSYTKQLKEKIAKLSRDQVLEYIQNGQIVIDGVTIEKDWLKITKKFTDKYTKSE